MKEGEEWGEERRKARGERHQEEGGRQKGHEAGGVARACWGRGPQGV